jgi:hypothetical protein
MKSLKGWEKSMKNGIGGEDKLEELDRGYCYLVKEEKPVLSFEIFEELSKGRDSLWITRIFPEKLKHGAHQLIWLSHTPGKGRCNPSALSSLSKIIFSTLEKDGTVLLDGLEYLSIHNGFDQALIFLENVNEFTMQKQGVVIIPVNPNAYNQRELALLERNIRVLESASDITKKDISSLIEEY